MVRQRIIGTIDTLLFVVLAATAAAQPTFKAGWNTYPTGTITREYTYYISNNDTGKIYLTDSLEIFASPDSLVMLTVHTPAHDRSVYKTINYFNARKQLVKTEEYKDDALTMSNEWQYDEKNRRKAHVEDNKVTGSNFRETFEYAADKKNGDMIVSGCTYNNGRVEFYTRTYYDKHNVKYKEVRLNDNNRDVVHIESFYYGDNGKLVERSIYFPEWKVTRKFPEKEGLQKPTCFRCMPVGTADKINLCYRLPFMKRLIVRNMPLMMNKDCDQFEYTFKNFTNCDIVIASCDRANSKKLTFRYREKLH